MTSDTIIVALTELANAEADDFPTLVRKFKIDPAYDLRYCDLRNVDFGNLIAGTLNLTGCLLEGADLSRVTCNKIIRDPDRPNATSDEVTELLKLALLAVYRYQNSDGLAQELVMERTLAAVVTFYHTWAEQEAITRSICKRYKKSIEEITIDGELELGMEILWFYRPEVGATSEIEGKLLDLAFINAVRHPIRRMDLGIYPSKHNYSRTKRIADAIREPKYKSIDWYRTEFIQALRKELKRPAVLVFSGFPPISKQLYRAMTIGLPYGIKLVFVCSSNYERQFTGQESRWQREAIPDRSIQAITTSHDLDNIDRRIRLASETKIGISWETRKKMELCVGAPISEVKNLLIKRIYELNTSPRKKLSAQDGLAL
jgi:hypothetical protein